METNFKTSAFYRLTHAIAGNANSFLLLLFIHIGFGLLFSFRIFNLHAILVIFGLISPVVFVFISYKLVFYNKQLQESLSLPTWMCEKIYNTLMIVVDSVFIIFIFLLIFLDIKDTLFLRLLITVIIPFVLLILIRVLFLAFPRD